MSSEMTDRTDQNFQSRSTSMAQGTRKSKEKKERSGTMMRGKRSVGVHVHFVNSVFEKIFSMGTSYFLHHAAVILIAIPNKTSGMIESERAKKQKQKQNGSASRDRLTEGQDS